MKKILIITFACLVCAVLLFAQVGTKAPDFSLKEFGTENKISVSELQKQGKVAVLAFFDSKCEPCKKELPKLTKVFNKYPEKAKVFLVCLDEKRIARKPKDSLLFTSIQNYN